MCMRFVLIHFQERFQIDAFSMKTQLIGVGERPKGIEMYAFSNKNSLVWTLMRLLLSRLLNINFQFQNVDIEFSISAS